jgi:hypothetical protein
MKAKIFALAIALAPLAILTAIPGQAATFALPGFSGRLDIAGPITGTQTIFISFAVDATIQMPGMDSLWQGFALAGSALSSQRQVSRVGERNQIDPAPQAEPSMHRCLIVSRLSGIA